MAEAIANMCRHAETLPGSVHEPHAKGLSSIVALLRALKKHDFGGSKEELQSMNEELNTVNTELKGKVDELSTTNNDLSHLLAATDIAMVFVAPIST